ncbi:MAG: NBR1-Ig-like domain-containing protein [Polyangiales bacterium]
MTPRSLASLFVLVAGCEPGEVYLSPDDAAPSDRVAPAPDAPAFDAPAPDARVPDASAPDAPAPLDVPAPDAPAPPPDAPPPPPPDAPDLGNDDAVFTEVWLPMTLGCNATVGAMLDVRNTGTTTWTARGGYALGAVGDSDPFAADGRVRLDADVPPGETRRFHVPMRAPGRAGTFTTDWRMVREGVRWFGATSMQDTRVLCGPAASTEGFSLAALTVVASPDVRDFPVTSRITSISFRPGTFHIDHERRGMWPPVQIDPDGTTQEATVWVFFHIDGRWYATGGERLRPNQTDKALDNPSSIGPDWLYDRGRWGDMTGYVPSPGDLVGFMVVAGSTRSDNHVIARERSGAVLIRFPRDGEETSFPAFAWQE